MSDVSGAPSRAANEGWSSPPPEVITAFTRDSVGEALGVSVLVGRLRGAKAFTEQATREYADRFLFELIQNAYDAHEVGATGTVRLVLDMGDGPHGCLYVANTGAPFTAADFHAICEISQSSKRPGEGIGNKGIGFKSVLQVAEWPEIYSAGAAGPGGPSFDGYCFGFARPRDMLDLVHGDEAAAGVLRDRLSPYGLPIAIDTQTPAVQDFATAGFSTVIRLPFRSPQGAERARAQLDQVVGGDAPLLLFLDRLAALEVDVRGPDGEQMIQVLQRGTERLPSPDAMDISEVDLGVAGRYLVASQVVDHERFMAAIAASVDATLVDAAWLQWEGDATVGVAVALDGIATGTPSDRLYCYLPMGSDAHSPLPGHVNAPFAVNLSRNGLVPNVPLNDLLLDVAADVVAAAVPYLAGHPRARSLIPDLISWRDADALRLVRAFSEVGTPLSTAPVVPILGPRRWGTFGEAFRWSGAHGTLTSAAVAAATDAEILDPAIGADRMDRLERLIALLPGHSLHPSLHVVSEWAEAVAVSMAADALRDPSTFDPEEWMGLYDDLAACFDRKDASDLRGRQILIDGDFGLHRTWGGTEGEGTAIFFPMREVADEEEATRDVSIPQTLGKYLAYMHPDLPWRTTNEQTRRLENRPGRDFLDRAALVRLPRTRDILERLARVLADRTGQRLHADALRLVFNLTSTRPYTQEPRLDALNLRVPTASGEWRPAARVRFSGAWPGTLGPQLARLVSQAAGASPDLVMLADGFLAAPSTFGFRVEPVEPWIAFLRRIGVADGLEPVPCGSVAVTHPGWWWTSPSLPAAASLSPGERASWTAALASAAERPNHPYTEYRLAGPVFRLPGAADHSALPRVARETYGRLVVAGLAHWPDATMAVRVARPRSVQASDPVSLPSPVSVFLRTASWLPVTRPREPGQADTSVPGRSWHYSDDDVEPQPSFMPLVVSQIRMDIDSDRLRAARLMDAGLHAWNRPTEAMARMRVLARVFRESDIPETQIANFRKACERTWAAIVAAGTSAGPALASDDSVVVSRHGQIGLYDLVPDGDPNLLHVLVDEDRLAAAVLDALEAPVLRADPRDGRAIAALMERVIPGRVRSVGAADIRVLIDGESVQERDGALLVPRGREWLTDIVALTLEFKASAFNRQAEQRIRAATDLVRAIRLHAGQHAQVELAGQSVQLPAHMRRVFALVDPLRPRIAYEGDADHVDWATLEMLAPKIGDIIGAAETSNALQNVIATLGHRLGGGEVRQPSDADYSAVFEESLDRVIQVRRSQRGAVVGLLYLLRPVVCALLDGEDPLRVAVDAAEGPIDAHEVADLLEPFDGRWPSDVTAAQLVERAVPLASLAEVRDEFGIDFATFNQTLRALSPAYAPIHNVDGHAVAFATFLGRDHAVMDRLRAAAAPTFDRGVVPDGYAPARQEFIRAQQRRARATADRAPMLDPDVAWLDTVELPSDAQMQARVEAWLDQVAPKSHHTGGTGLVPLPDVQAANLRAVHALARRARVVLPAWSAKRGGIAPPTWVTAGTSDIVISQLSDLGLLDFRVLDDGELIAWLRRLDLWQDGLPDTVDPALLGLTDADLRAQESEVAKNRWERALARRSVAIDGTPWVLEPDDTAALIDAVRSGITPGLLATPTKVRSLKALVARPRRQGGQGGSSSGGGKIERPTSDQTDLIGFIGELVAYQWLEHRYGIDPSRWRSRSRRFAYVDGDPGDDSLGYDFEVLRAKGKPLLFEVKSTTTDTMAFEMSDNEIGVAQSNANSDRYRILFVGRVNDSAERWIAVLPNPASDEGRGRYRLVGRGIRYEFAAH